MRTARQLRRALRLLRTRVGVRARLADEGWRGAVAGSAIEALYEGRHQAFSEVLDLLDEIEAVAPLPIGVDADKSR